MRKFALLLIVIVAVFLSGCSGEIPSPYEGIYQLKLKTLTIFDLDPKNLTLYWNFAELTDSKPEELKVEEGIDYQKFQQYKFGFFRLGNNEEKVWLLMTKDSIGYWNDFYIDQNCDLTITKKEKVKSFQTNQGKDHGFITKESFSLIPISIKVNYKGFTKEYEKNLYFFISTVDYSKKDKSDPFVRIISASFLEGEVKVLKEKDEKLVSFRIIDTNGNGCFNDFGKDYIYMDLNNDGFYKKNESQTLNQFFDSESGKKQLRLNMLPFSLKLAIIEATADFDLSQLEPEQNVTPETPEAKNSPAVSDDSVAEDEPVSGGEKNN